MDGGMGMEVEDESSDEEEFDVDKRKSAVGKSFIIAPVVSQNGMLNLYGILETVMDIGTFVQQSGLSIVWLSPANLQQFLKQNVSYGWSTVGVSIRKQYRDIGQCSLDPKIHSPLLNSRDKCYIQADPIVLLDKPHASKSYQKGSRSYGSCAAFGATLVDTNPLNNDDTSMDQWHQCAVSNSSIFAVTNPNNALGKLLNLSTAWILLGQSSTECYKHLGNIWLYKRNQCSMKMLQETYIMKRLSAGQSDSSLQLLARRMGGNNLTDISNVMISGARRAYYCQYPHL
ncbi:uncharacterized protein LOC135819015 [Sycon ciliatum]|uniref:uncharacterized protein LOC135819015 n=1 Tax=Sycon ciliatum TaxID=27933 RepID=UPI0031F70F52